MSCLTWTKEFGDGKEAIGLEQVVTKLRQMEVLMGEGRGLQQALREWLATVGAKTLYIERGSPWKSGYKEGFNGKLRDECLNQELFYSLKEAQVVIEVRRQEYNRVRPHSSLGHRPPPPATYRPNPLTLEQPHALQ